MLRLILAFVMLAHTAFAQQQAARPANPVDIITALGYTPIQQCGGTNQLCNRIRLGWDGSDLRLMVDVSDIGKLASQGWANNTFRLLTTPPGSNVATLTKTVFIGGTGARFGTLADPVANAVMLANGRIGLYEHGQGMSVLTPAQRSALWATWSQTGINATGAGQAVGEVGEFTPVPPTYTAYFGGQYPNEVNMNVVSTGIYTAASTDAKPGTVYGSATVPSYFSATDLINIEAAITAANAAGAKNVAVFVTPNAGNEDLDDPFASAPAWANARAAALFGGGIVLDVPPSYWAARNAAYQNYIQQMVAWGRNVHIRTAIVVSPYANVADSAGNSGNQGYDPNFQANTQLLYSNLASVGALPTQWGVETYSNPGATSNDVETDTTPNSLNSVALFLASVTAQPSGTKPAGSNGVADYGLLGNALLQADIVGALGFTPARQGTGPNQLGNAVSVGWDGTQVRVSVDTSDIGPVIFQNQTINTPAMFLTSCAASATGLGHGALWCDSSNVVHRVP